VPDPANWTSTHSPILFVTLQGLFILCRATGDPRHLRGQPRTVRVLLERLLRR